MFFEVETFNHFFPGSFWMQGPCKGLMHGFSNLSFFRQLSAGTDFGETYFKSVPDALLGGFFNSQIGEESDETGVAIGEASTLLELLLMTCT